MRRNERHKYDNEPWAEKTPREGVNKLPNKDSVRDGVIGRERLDPHHRIGERNESFGERHDY